MNIIAVLAVAAAFLNGFRRVVDDDVEKQLFILLLSHHEREKRGEHAQVVVLVVNEGDLDEMLAYLKISCFVHCNVVWFMWF